VPAEGGEGEKENSAQKKGKSNGGGETKEMLQGKRTNAKCFKKKKKNAKRKFAWSIKGKRERRWLSRVLETRFKQHGGRPHQAIKKIGGAPEANKEKKGNALMLRPPFGCRAENKKKTPCAKGGREKIIAGKLGGGARKDEKKPAAQNNSPG